MEGEDSLHSYTIRYLADGESGVYPSFAFAYDHTLKNLNAFFVSFPDSHMNLYCIPGLKLGDICPHLFSIE
jgi:hypothetical protein